MDVAAWLRCLGLEQYEKLFRENDVDAEVLGDLTDGDLEKIGVSLGHRKRLLKAVAALAGRAPASPTTSTAVLLAPEAAERRQLTVMFCDLVGSTALSVLRRSHHEGRRFRRQIHGRRGARLLRLSASART
jgi:class 3 adenylate cyclase